MCVEIKELKNQLQAALKTPNYLFDIYCRQLKKNQPQLVHCKAAILHHDKVGRHSSYTSGQKATAT